MGRFFGCISKQNNSFFSLSFIYTDIFYRLKLIMNVADNKKDSDSISTTAEQTTHTPLSSDSTHHQEEEQDLSQDLETELRPPFLVKTKTREEKESMRQQFKKQEESRKDKGAYEWLQRLYARFSTSFMLENKAAVARDHLGKIEKCLIFDLHATFSLY
jgi:hypothetical protein